MYCLLARESKPKDDHGHIENNKPVVNEEEDANGNGEVADTVFHY